MCVVLIKIISEFFASKQLVLQLACAVSVCNNATCEDTRGPLTISDTYTAQVKVCTRVPQVSKYLFFHKFNTTIVKRFLTLLINEKNETKYYVYCFLLC